MGKNKKFKNALVLGKFYPITNGHLFLIDSAIKQSVTVHIMVCSLKSEKIPGELRYEWMKLIYKDNPNVNIIHITDENPQYPEEHENFWNIWYNTVYNNVKKLDVIFTSEEYGDPFSKVLGIKHILVDLNRENVQISGTKVRNNPVKYWDFIPDIVKPYFQKKIVIIGAESTGKSTMVDKLSKYFNSDKITEYGREYTELMDDINLLSKKDLENIAKIHYNNVFVNNSISPYLFVDTEAIVTKVFGTIYINENFESKIIDNIISNQKYDLYVLLENDVPYINDGTRLPEYYRHISNSRIKKELNKFNINYISISGSYQNRFDKIVKIIKKL